MLDHRDRDQRGRRHPVRVRPAVRPLNPAVAAPSAPPATPQARANSVPVTGVGTDPQVATATDGPERRPVGQRDRGQHAPREHQDGEDHARGRAHHHRRARTPRRGPPPTGHPRSSRSPGRAGTPGSPPARSRTPGSPRRRRERREPPVAQEVGPFAPPHHVAAPSAGTSGPDRLVRREREVMGEDAAPGPGRSNTVPKYRAVDGVARATGASGCTMPATNSPAYESRSRPGTSATRRRARPGRAPPRAFARPRCPRPHPARRSGQGRDRRTGTRAPATGTTRRGPRRLTNDPSSTGSSNRTRSATEHHRRRVAERDPRAAQPSNARPFAERRGAAGPEQQPRGERRHREQRHAELDGRRAPAGRFAPGKLDASTARSPSNTSATWWNGPR